jgi:hypothetical protein
VLTLIAKGELEHKRIKRFFRRTNKGRTFVGQMAHRERRHWLIITIRERVNAQTGETTSRRITQRVLRKRKAGVSADDSDALPRSDPSARFHVSHERRRFHVLQEFESAGAAQGDVALKVSELHPCQHSSDS